MDTVVELGDGWLFCSFDEIGPLPRTKPATTRQKNLINTPLPNNKQEFQRTMENGMATTAATNKTTPVT